MGGAGRQIGENSASALGQRFSQGRASLLPPKMVLKSREFKPLAGFEVFPRGLAFHPRAVTIASVGEARHRAIRVNTPAAGRVGGGGKHWNACNWEIPAVGSTKLKN
jgi:hypothetical protein